MKAAENSFRLQSSENISTFFRLGSVGSGASMLSNGLRRKNGHRNTRRQFQRTEIGGTPVINFYLFPATTNFPRHYSRTEVGSRKIDNWSFSFLRQRNRFLSLFKPHRRVFSFFLYLQIALLTVLNHLRLGFIRVQIMAPAFSPRSFPFLGMPKLHNECNLI